MSQQVTKTTVMNEYRSIRMENGIHKFTTVTLCQYDDTESYSPSSFLILSHSVEFSSSSTPNTLNEYVIRDGKEAMIRTINLWNSVIMEKDYEADKPTAEDDSDYPF